MKIGLRLAVETQPAGTAFQTSTEKACREPQSRQRSQVRGHPGLGAAYWPLVGVGEGEEAADRRSDDPFAFSDVALGAETNNPHAVRTKAGEWLLFHTNDNIAEPTVPTCTGEPGSSPRLSNAALERTEFRGDDRGETRGGDGGGDGGPGGGTGGGGGQAAVGAPADTSGEATPSGEGT